MCNMPRVMHRKMTFNRYFLLSKNLRSATLDLHAKAPGRRQRVVTRRGRDRFFGLRFGQPSGSGDSGPRDVGPGDLGSPSGAPWFGEIGGVHFGGPGSLSGVRLRLRPSSAGPEGDVRAITLLAFRRLSLLPPARERRPGRERSLFGGFGPPDASGAFGIPPGSSEPWRNPPGPTGTSGLPRRFFGTGLVTVRVPGKSSGFRGASEVSRRGPSGPGGSSDRSA